MNAGIHKLTAGSGYLYLVRQVAAHDRTHGPESLGDYYSSKGETPGRWGGRGLAGLSAGSENWTRTDAGDRLWSVAEGSEVTEDQMKALFGLGVHPNASALTKQLIAQGARKNSALTATSLGRPFRVNAGETELQQRLALAYRDHNLSIGAHWNAAIDESVRAQMRTDIATEMFEEQHRRAPLDERELTGFIARGTRDQTTSVAGYDMTFTPVKSVSALYALCPEPIAKQIEECHSKAVQDALDFLQDQAAYTRIGAQGIAQVDTEGFITAEFLHRDTRASDPGLHTHVAISNKVRARGTDGIARWYALDGRPLYASTVAASELYNSRLEAYLGQVLGMRFAARGDAREGKREVREVVGVSRELNELWSSRRAAIDAEYAVLAKKFQAAHGREPTTPESIAMFQQATLATRDAKHEPRSLAEQRQEWRTQAVGLLGSDEAVNAMIARSLAGRTTTPAEVTDSWIKARAAQVIATVSAARATWNRTHVLAEALRVVRVTGHAGIDGIAELITDAALAEPLSIRHACSPDTDLGEPARLRRRDGSSVYRQVGSQTYTSHEILAAERSILAAAELRDGRTVPAADVEIELLAQAAHRRELNAGQAQLVREMACRGQRVMLALAPAGSGKTTAMAALARSWEGAGGTVIGLSPSASAAQLLREEIEVEVGDTLDKFNWLTDNPDIAPGDPARQWYDAIDENTLIIVDEAGKAGTLALASMIAVALARGASVRLVGDDKQLSSISAGGVLRDLAHRHGAITLSQVMRFASAAEAQAGLALRDGDPSGIAFYLDEQRVHVGTQAAASDMAFQAWQSDIAAGEHSLLLAPTHDLVSELNDRARLHRLTELGARAPGIEAVLMAGARASVGDLVFTKENDRTLALGATDFVRNGYRWEVTEVDPEGSITVKHLESGAHLRLPAEYVRAHVTLGYARTIDATQGATARYRCHTVGSDQLTRQQVYTALTRGVYGNHIYFSTAEHDPHRVLSPKATHPDTAVDVLTRALGRDAAQVSATSAARAATDPAARLAAATAMYAHAVGAAAESRLSPAQHAELDSHAEKLVPGLTSATAWPVLRQHLALIAAAGIHPLKRLDKVVAAGGFDNAADPAAVIDWRLDPTGAHSGGAGPLSWLPAIPERLAADPHWSTYLAARAQRVDALAEEVRATSAQWTAATAPRWARPLVDTDAELAAELAVYRAATAVDDNDTRIAGPEQYPARTRAAQRGLEQRAAELIGTDATTNRYDDLIDSINPHIRRDPYWPQLASQLASASRTGVNITQLVRKSAADRPLPDELPAAALWWRLCGTMSPAALETANGGLRPDWLPDLHTVFGTELAETIAADPALPALVSAISNADPDQWTPLDLLHVAAEHLYDADAHLTHHLRADEYARLLTYSIEVFTTDDPYDHDIPLPEHAPLTPEEHEELAHLHPDIENTPAWRQHSHEDVLADPNNLAAALGLDEYDLTEPTEPDEQLPPPEYAHDVLDAESHLDFDSLSTRRPTPAAALAAHRADVHALRARYAAAELRELAAQVSAGNGPHVRAATDELRRMRDAADADRPFLARVETVLDQWHEAETTYTEALELINHTRTELDTLRADPDADPLDIASATQNRNFLTSYQLPTRSPAEQFHPAFQEATAARAAAAGGSEHIVTHADADALLRRCRADDDTLLARHRADRAALREQLHRTELAAAQAFAHAQRSTAEHITDLLPRIDAELRVLDAAGQHAFQDRLPIPEHPDIDTHRLHRLTDIPFVLTAAHASDRAALLPMMNHLARAAHAAQRPLIWAAPATICDNPDLSPINPTVIDAATIDLTDSAPGTIVIIDRAEHLTPETIADLTENAATAHARIILLDTNTATWPPPAAPLLKLLHTELRWSPVLTASTGRINHYQASPDTDAALTQAAGLHPDQHTPAITNALQRHRKAQQRNTTAHELHTRMWNAAHRGDGLNRDVDHSRDR
ncbi:MobF family relaxase [Mycolicibacterium vinylchloridicum]|uniref:MobF family relaxase n=1 Tax=Mycolicibacterium vinylchloridicum TaxID=2736928 RepID=UPI0015C85814|nr:MobF family relaxase [Mycolicibacterium vinylchloridicum]